MADIIGLAEAVEDVTLADAYDCPPGIYNQVENFNIFMNFVRQGCQDGKSVYVASPFVDNPTFLQLIQHTVTGSEYTVEQIDDYLKRDPETSQRDEQLEHRLKAAKSIYFYTRQEEYDNINPSYKRRVANWTVKLSPARVAAKYFHCKFAACRDADGVRVLLTSANLTQNHMKPNETGSYHQRDSSVSVTMTKQEFASRFLLKMDITASEDETGAEN